MEHLEEGDQIGVGGGGGRAHAVHEQRVTEMQKSFTFNKSIVRTGREGKSKKESERGRDRAPWLPDLTQLCKQNK